MYVIEFIFDLGDLGNCMGAVKGEVETHEFGHTAKIINAVLFLDNQKPIDITDRLTKAVRVDIEERLAAKHVSQRPSDRRGA